MSNDIAYDNITSIYNAIANVLQNILLFELAAISCPTTCTECRPRRSD